MGLDVVELVIRCEEEFGVELDSHLLESTRTVGELFEIICAQLNLSDPDTLQPINRPSVPRPIAVADGWTRDAVWAELVRLIADQFQVAPDRITYTASFLDLGAD
jgi:acyl carrier protein